VPSWYQNKIPQDTALFICILPSVNIKIPPNYNKEIAKLLSTDLPITTVSSFSLCNTLPEGHFTPLLPEEPVDATNGFLVLLKIM
jgi:hypothetical protein